MIGVHLLFQCSTSTHPRVTGIQRSEVPSDFLILKENILQKHIRNLLLFSMDVLYWVG